MCLVEEMEACLYRLGGVLWGADMASTGRWRSGRRRGKRGRRGLPGVMAELCDKVAWAEVVCTVVVACASLRVRSADRGGVASTARLGRARRR